MARPRPVSPLAKADARNQGKGRRRTKGKRQAWNGSSKPTWKAGWVLAGVLLTMLAVYALSYGLLMLNRDSRPSGRFVFVHDQALDDRLLVVFWPLYRLHRRCGGPAHQEDRASSSAH
jgi:hypothetical protein